MIMEIRRYEIEPGRRDEFVTFFEDEVVPAMEAVGMTIVGQFTSVEDPNAFFYLRSFSSDEERDRQHTAFYESARWRTRLKARALEMETGYHVELVTPTPRSGLH